MLCPHCKKQNPEANKFCGECGRVLPRTPAPVTSLGESGPRATSLITPAAERASGNPMVNETRAVRDQLDFENAAKAPSRPLTEQIREASRENIRSHVEETARARVGERGVARETRDVNGRDLQTGGSSNDDRRTPPVVPNTVDPPSAPIAESTKPPIYTDRAPNAGHALPSNRISGPSFLGLSDLPSESAGGTYLLEDEPTRSSWRGWVFLALLIVFGILIYRHWAIVSAAGAELTSRAHMPVQTAQKEPAPPAVDASSDVSAVANAKPGAGSSDNGTPAASSASTVSPSTPGVDSGASKQPTETSENSAPAVASKPDASPAGTTSEDAKPESDREENVSPEETAAAKPPETAGTGTRTNAAVPSKAKKIVPAEPRFDNAQVDLADKYIHGRGVPQNCAQGLALLNHEVAKDNPRAAIQMGALYASGTCVQQDSVHAYRLFAEALQKNPSNHWLERSMTSIWTSMSDQERERAAH